MKACKHRAESMALQVYAKEEELVELQAKLGERDTALKAFKTENGRFADMKDKFKADITSLQQQVLIPTLALLLWLLDIFFQLAACIRIRSTL